jgi:hypothetical protein
MAEGAFVALGVCPKTTCLSEVTRPELPDAPWPLVKSLMGRCLLSGYYRRDNTRGQVT